MRSIARRPLSADTLQALTDTTTQVMAAEDPSSAAATRWKTKPDGPFAEIKRTLREMAGGRERCMYCEDNEGTDIEHFWPKSSYPERAFLWENYLLACSNCNSNHKRAQFPVIEGQPALIDPCDPNDRPTAHLRLVIDNGRYEPIGPKGQPSIDVFDLNGDRRGRRLPEGRFDTLVAIQALLHVFEEMVRRGDLKRAEDVRRTITRQPFTAVLEFLANIGHRPEADGVLFPGVADIIRRHGVAQW